MLSRTLARDKLKCEEFRGGAMSINNDNTFKAATDAELLTYCKQYKEWQKTGILTDNELGKLRDIYSEKSNIWQIQLMTDLLDALIDRFTARQKNQIDAGIDYFSIF